MADVFISYSSVDRSRAELVDAALSSAGYSVWWDRSLVAGQRYQMTIARELSAAQTVVVLWTPSSVLSDWVYSEARRAHQRGVLIQARDPGLDIDDLPAPFDALHCALIEDLGAITTAVSSLCAPSGAMVEDEQRSSRPPLTASKLPALTGTTIGRDGEQRELLDLLIEGERLITLTGPGGTGKTRLAIAVAERAVDTEGLPTQAVFVGLETETTAAEMWAALASIIEGVDSDETRAGVLRAVEGLDAIIVLDNVEQVVDADDVVRDLLASGSGARLLVTSRRPLHVEGEQEHAVPPLQVPSGDDLKHVGESGATQLFVNHAARVRRDFVLDESNCRDVATLCRALDGLPLAIELVAARSKLLGPAALLARLSSVLDIESADRSRTSRQRTIRETVRWSFNLLTPRHQAVLVSLAVFPGGASLEAAESVIPGSLYDGLVFEDVIFDLVDDSLLRVSSEAGGEPRLTMLETVRAFCIEEQLDERELAVLWRAHAQFFYDLTTALYAGVESASYADLRGQFLRELPNIEAAVRRLPREVTDEKWYGHSAVPWADQCALVSTLAGRFRRYTAASAWAAAGLDPPSTSTAYAACLAVRADVEGLTGAGPALELASRAYDVLKDSPVQAGPDWVATIAVATHVLMTLSNLQQEAGQLDASAATVAELLDLTADAAPRVRIRALNAGVLQAFFTEEFEAALVLLDECETLSRAADDQRMWLHFQNSAAEVEMRLGRRDVAARRLVAIVNQVRGTGDPEDLCYFAESLGAALGQQDPMLAARLYGAANALREEEGLPRSASEIEDDEWHVAPIRDLLPVGEWQRGFQAGATEMLDVLLGQLADHLIG